VWKQIRIRTGRLCIYATTPSLAGQGIKIRVISYRDADIQAERKT